LNSYLGLAGIVKIADFRSDPVGDYMVPTRFAAFITAESGLGPQAVPNLRMSVPNGNQIAPTATKTHCCACGFEICVPVSYTGTQSPFLREGLPSWSESLKSKSLQNEWRLELRRLLVVP
jgi:hypothetical protein